MTKIEWTDRVWNPVTGCTKVSQGCKNCYAERFAGRQMGPWKGRKFEDVRCHTERLDSPLHWRKPSRVFVNSMSDLFHKAVPFEFIEEVWLTMIKSPRHTFQILTKRPYRMTQFFEWANKKCDFPVLKNVWLGVSVEDQATADKRIPLLLQTPAAVRFISAEPLLGPVDLKPWLTKEGFSGFPDPGMNRIDWVICGGESGPRGRPMHPDWAHRLRDQCQAAGVPFFFKQFGEWAPSPNGDWMKKNKHTFPDGGNVFRVGKNRAGRVLDGRTWDEFPK